ncbi:hypothetical protein DFH27DRAFT_251048 [Peziza echinospora]|nr:hypothetical protein DFH27DRAFT_251048 [Peziza echinospora]
MWWTRSIHWKRSRFRFLSIVKVSSRFLLGHHRITSLGLVVLQTVVKRSFSSVKFDHLRIPPGSQDCKLSDRDLVNSESMRDTPKPLCLPVRSALCLPIAPAPAPPATPPAPPGSPPPPQISYNATQTSSSVLTAGRTCTPTTCPLCERNPLYQYFLNGEQAILMCSDKACAYPFNLTREELRQVALNALMGLSKGKKYKSGRL